MDKTNPKDLEYYRSNDNIERVHVQVGLEKKNIKNTYINQLGGKDKTKMLTAISLGAMCMEYNITHEELKDGIAFIMTSRNINGIS